MTDKTKLLVLVALTLLGATLILGIGLTPDNYQYFLSRRTPKVIAVVLSGTAIALSSLAFQTITHNRILTPGIMGFDALYMLIQVLIVYMLGGFSEFLLNPYLNFIVCVVLMVSFSFLLFQFYFHSGKRNLMILLLLGVVLGQLFSNIASMFSLMLDPNEFTMVQSSMFASFNNVKTELIYISAPIIALSAFWLFKLNNVLNVMWLDNDNAISLGVDVRNVTKKVLLLSTLLIAVSTALVGPILFFGLLVTNLTREWLTGYQHKTLFLGCILISLVTLLGGQLIIEHVLEFETTLSVVINFFGGLYFLRILLKNKIM
ncbi:iron chelate uptake ABC transporter family permease subunit [Vibrio sp. HN007]|uniref:iron chelate uptake ABC transporter family permease subunit n=1 Tax=Vibrio iocasae TaxID=3098914 RepID=UPI0035D442B5